MEIEHFDDSKKGHFKALDNGSQAGIMTYVWAGEGKIIIDHTEADPQYKGQGVGMKMLNDAVAYARENGVKIIPLCPFAKKMFDKNEEIRDVLA